MALDGSLAMPIENEVNFFCNTAVDFNCHTFLIAQKFRMSAKKLGTNGDWQIQNENAELLRRRAGEI